MKNKLIILMILLYTISLNSIKAQYTLPDNYSLKQPVLIHDTHSESFKKVETLLSAIPISALKLLTDLSLEQQKDILRIEKCRDKKLLRTNRKLKSEKIEWAELQIDAIRNKRQISNTINEISKLAIYYKKTISKSADKIRTKLSQSQQLEFNKVHKLAN